MTVVARCQQDENCTGCPLCYVATGATVCHATCRHSEIHWATADGLACGEDFESHCRIATDPAEVTCEICRVACVPEPASVEFDDQLAAGCDVVEGWR